MPSFYRKPVCKLKCSAVDPKELPRLRNTTWSVYPPYLDFFSKDEEFPKRVDRIIGWLKSDDPPRFVALYIDHPDWEGHSDGALSTAYKDSTEKVDEDAVGYLLDQLEKEKFIDEVNLIFVRDHSMVNTSSDRVISLDNYIEPSTYRLIESGPIGHIWPNEAKLDEIYNNLTNKPHDYFHVYKKEQIPEDFVQPDVGWTVTKSNATATPGKWIYGSHGWPSKDAKTYSIFFAQGPVFKVGYKIEPFSILDVYPMMCDLLGIEPRPHNGTMETDRKMYKQEEAPTAGQQSIIVRSSCSLFVAIFAFVVEAL